MRRTLLFGIMALITATAVAAEGMRESPRLVESAPAVWGNCIKPPKPPPAEPIDDVWIMDDITGLPFCRVRVPPDWKVEGNAGWIEPGGTFSFAFWLRFSDPKEKRTYEMVMPIGKFKWVSSFFERDKNKNDRIYRTGEKLFFLRPRAATDLLEDLVLPVVQAVTPAATVEKIQDDPETGERLKKTQTSVLPVTERSFSGGTMLIRNGDKSSFFVTAFSHWNTNTHLLDVSIYDSLWAYLFTATGPLGSEPGPDELEKAVLGRIQINPAWLREGGAAWREETKNDGLLQCDDEALYRSRLAESGRVIRAAVQFEGDDTYYTSPPALQPEEPEKNAGYADAVFSMLTFASRFSPFGTIEKRP